MNAKSLCVALAVLPCLAGAQTLRVRVDDRSPQPIDVRVSEAVRQFNQNLAELTRAHRQRLVRAGAYHTSVPLSFPVRVSLESDGRELRSPRSRSRAPITLVFDNSGARAFDPAYRALLQSVFDQAQGTMDAVFGAPALGGQVHVRNYDADIFDREAVAGGYYLPNNGSGQQEIRFPVYLSPEAAAVNFVHTLLLAYLGPNQYGFDAFGEGLVRAATMSVVRQPTALPATLDQAQAERVLDSLYDVGAYYDWYNQRALGGPEFVAPNLREVPLPAGGSLGGIYLLRYQMAGTAWQKVLAEHPAFARFYNEAFYANPTIANSEDALIALGQTVLNSLNPGSPTVEGRSFPEWAKRQFILETDLTYGLKLLVQPTPISSGLSGSDFGVFDILTTYFATATNGDETLLSGTSYPIFWDRDFNRVFTSAQEDVMPIAGAFGSVTPNFPNLFAGKPYRMTVDIPVQDQVARAYLPAGAIATASSAFENDFFGTIVGLGTGTSTVSVLSAGGATLASGIPIENGAFGARINTTAYLSRGSFTVKVFRNSQEVLSRRVNKGPGPLGVDLRVDGDISQALNLPKGLSTVGFFVEPWESHIPTILGTSEDSTLVARYNPSRAAYDLYPQVEPFKLGHGFFVRMPADSTRQVQGLTSPGTPTTVALRPGWNLVSSPLPENVPTSRVSVVRAADFPRTFAEAAGTDVGLDVFQFVPGPNDAATGAPETGSMVATTTFEAGKAVYVRVLAPEGITLLFEPATSLRPTRSRAATASAERGTWTLRLSIDGLPAQAIIGQRRGGSRGFSADEDSELPPLMGGPQVWVEDSARLFRDMREAGARDTYRVRMTGLVKGRRYTFRSQTDVGRVRSIVVSDGRVRRTLGPDSTFSFVASAAEQTITVTAGGSR